MAKQIKPSDLIAVFQSCLSQRWGYIYGQSGDVWTAAKQAKATREQTIKWGSRWIGHNVADCSGLFSFAFKKLGGFMYHGSNTMMKRYTTASGKLVNGKRTDGKELLPGTAVFKLTGTDNYHHVGLYIGNGTVIEAKGTAYGVVTSKVSIWHAWGELRGVDYSAAGTTSPVSTSTDGNESPSQASSQNTHTTTARTLKRTSPMMRGDDVRTLQTQLTSLGFNCGAIDGIFGDKTLAAVKQYQASAGLVVDGVVGSKTWAALNRAIGNLQINSLNSYG